MIRAALGLTSMLLLTACAGSGTGAQYDASGDTGFTNARMQHASTSSSVDMAAFIPSPKFKPVWLELAAMKDESDAADIASANAEEAPVGYVFQDEEPADKSKSMLLAGNEKVSDSELDKNRGTFTPEVLNSTVLEATHSDNVSINSVTGNNIVDSSAFSSAAGLVNLIQNSGNNVVIQSSTVVNLTFQ